MSLLGQRKKSISEVHPSTSCSHSETYYWQISLTVYYRTVISVNQQSVLCNKKGKRHNTEIRLTGKNQKMFALYPTSLHYSRRKQNLVKKQHWVVWICVRYLFVHIQVFIKLFTANLSKMVISYLLFMTAFPHKQGFKYFNNNLHIQHFLNLLIYSTPV